MSCGVNAIVSDKHGRAYIDPDKCVSCGMCMVACPFGAISDKSQIFQLTNALKEGGEIVAEIAPAFVDQFGANITPRNLKAALQELGFSEVYEVALGADIGAISEAHHYVEKVTTGELPFLLTSCCPSWAMLAKKYFPDLIDQISEELTPMVATARTIKKEHPNARVVFIGPCAAKKLEASRKSVRSDVDFVVTFEELAAMFEAKNIDLTKYQAESSFHDATGAGRGYAYAGGVSEAIEKCINTYYPGVPVKIEHAEGLSECKKVLALAKAGKMTGCMIEGMGCPGGCIAGAGTNIPIPKAKKAVENYVKNSTQKVPDKELAEIELK
jgi:[FeFe] hydrogenase (group B1/B3)